MDVTAGTRIRAVYALAPQPSAVVWPWFRGQLRAKWAGQPGVRILDVNGNIQGLGIRTDEFYFEAVATSRVDAELAFPSQAALQIGGRIYTLHRSSLTTRGGGERPPTAGETFGEADWWELPAAAGRQVFDVVPPWLRLATVLGLILFAFVYFDRS